MPPAGETAAVFRAILVLFPCQPHAGFGNAKESEPFSGWEYLSRTAHLLSG